MAILPLKGHDDVRTRVARAFAAGRLPQVLLLTGPEGVGKQRLALWIGQLVLCDRPTDQPCGRCQSCRLAVAIEHPDLHWFVPVERPKSGDQDRQVEEAADRIGEQLVLRREKGRWGPAEGLAAHGVASAHLLLRRAALTPVQSKKKVFIVGEANRLVPQESSPEAANALLKFLEEPPADTVVLLTATEPEQVLPTIRSRAVQLRLAPLPDAQVREFASAHLSDGDVSEADIRGAAGAIGRLAAPVEASEKATKAARTITDAVRSGGGAAYERALAQAPWQARGAFTDLLDALAVELSQDIRKGMRREDAAAAVAALSKVHAAREQAQGNVNPQLILAALVDELTQVSGER
jgi:DNA polymerase III subunit delta'